MKSRNGFAVIAVLLVAILLVVVGGILYLHYYSSQSTETSSSPQAAADQNLPGIDPVKAQVQLQEAIQQYASSSELYLMPTPLIVPSSSVFGYQTFSYYGTSFSVPWKDAPTIKTSTPSGLLTLLHFSENGSPKIIEAFSATSSISPYVNGVLSGFLGGVSKDGTTPLATFETLFAPDFDSTFNFVSSSLYSSPIQLSFSGDETPSAFRAASGLLFVKNQIFHFLETIAEPLPMPQISGVYSFSNPSVRGFEFVGAVDVGTTTQNFAHFLFFDQQDQSFNLMTVGATQNENAFIAASLKAN